MRFLAGPYWYALLLAPIAIVCGFLKVRLLWTMVLVVFCQAVMLLTWYIVTGFWERDIYTGVVYTVVGGAVVDVGVQVLTWMIGSLLGRGKRE